MGPSPSEARSAADEMQQPPMARSSQSQSPPQPQPQLYHQHQLQPPSSPTRQPHFHGVLPAQPVRLPPLITATSATSTTLASTLPYRSDKSLAPLSTPSPSVQHDRGRRTLPSLSSITGDHTLHQHRQTSLAAMTSTLNHMASPSPPLWHPSNPQPSDQSPTQHQQQQQQHPHHSHLPNGLISRPPPTHQERAETVHTMDMDTRSNSVVSIASLDGTIESRSGSVTLDDPDVRLAAEALGDLRADFLSSPPNLKAVLPTSPPAALLPGTRSQSPQAPEPLFSLLTTTHPLLATTIEGATSAYGGVKNYSPRFKSSAEYVEGYLTPIANTVGSVGRVTGVEGGVRWFLGAGRRQRSDVEAGGSKKRRKLEDVNERNPKRLEAQSFPRSEEAGNLQDSFPPTPKDSRRMSFASTVDTLPAYDDMRSPAYTETMEPQAGGSTNSQANAAWQSRLIMSTSGLSVAMSDESLRSLKYCLTWLRWANEHIGGVVGTLKVTLDQYDEPDNHSSADQESSAMIRDDSDAEAQTNEKTAEETREELATRIDSLKGDVLKTLKDAINMVSKYAGGALPENARILVRRHLTSLPQRFRIATMSEGNAQAANGDRDSAVRESAQKVLVLAKEGLDMVSQVSGVLDGTIVSAEEWCERMGKKRRDSRELQNQPTLPQVEPSVDTKMG